MPIIYRPARILNREKIDTFRCMPVTESANGGIITGKPALQHGRDIMLTAKENAAVLTQAFQDLSLAFDGGERIRMIVPINSYALASSDTSSLMIQAFKELDPAIRKEVILDVFDFPNPLTLDILDDITIRLMPFFDKLMAEPASDMDDFTIFANCNYFGVSLDLEARDVMGEAAIGVMTRFWGEATKRRLKVVVQGISEPELSEKADRYEVFLQDGPCIGKDVNAPVPFTP